MFLRKKRNELFVVSSPDLSRHKNSKKKKKKRRLSFSFKDANKKKGGLHKETKKGKKAKARDSLF